MSCQIVRGSIIRLRGSFGEKRIGRERGSWQDRAGSDVEALTGQQRVDDFTKALPGFPAPLSDIHFSDAGDAGGQIVDGIGGKVLPHAAGDRDALAEVLQKDLPEQGHDPVVGQKLEDIRMVNDVPAESVAHVHEGAAAGSFLRSGIIAAVLLQGIGDHVVHGLEEAVEGLPGNVCLVADGAYRNRSIAFMFQKREKGVGDLPLGLQCRLVSATIHECLDPFQNFFFKHLDSCQSSAIREQFFEPKLSTQRRRVLTTGERRNMHGSIASI